jgi:hypothetical protein
MHVVRKPALFFFAQAVERSDDFLQFPMRMFKIRLRPATFYHDARKNGLGQGIPAFIEKLAAGQARLVGNAARLGKNPVFASGGRTFVFFGMVIHSTIRVITITKKIRCLFLIFGRVETWNIIHVD